MGVRKREMAERMKEERKSTAFAKLNDCPSSPRKMRLVADIIRGKDVFKACCSSNGKVASFCNQQLAS
jgi:large subunit ribosomal protein L22